MISPMEFEYISSTSIINNQNRNQRGKKHFGKPVPQSTGQSHKCPNCPSCFSHHRNLTRHLKYECLQPPRFQCPHCHFRSKQTSNVLAHIRTQHVGLPSFVLHLGKEN